MIKHELLKKLLRDAHKARKLVSVRLKKHSYDVAEVGFVKKIEQDSFFMKSLDRHGNVDGEKVLRFQDIIHIDYNDRYAIRLLKMYKSKLFKKKPVAKTVSKSARNLAEKFNQLIANETLCTFNFHDYWVTGILVAFTDEGLFVKNIGIEGDEDGQSYHSRDKFINLKYAGIEEIRTAFLYKNRAEFYPA